MNPGSILWLDSVDSTQLELRRRLGDTPPEGLTVAARTQTEGRGRRGSAWYSPSETGLYLSTLLHAGSNPAQWTRWTLAAGVSMAEACEAQGYPVALKWPNDLMRAGRKIGGILAETLSVGGRPQMIVGVGMNLVAPLKGYPDDIADRAGSLVEQNSPPSRLREELAERFLERLLAYHRGLLGGAWDAVADAWSVRAPGAEGHRVTYVADDGTTHNGLTQGLDEDGALRVTNRRVRAVDRLRWLDDPSRPRKLQ